MLILIPLIGRTPLVPIAAAIILLAYKTVFFQNIRLSLYECTTLPIQFLQLSSRYSINGVVVTWVIVIFDILNTWSIGPPGVLFRRNALDRHHPIFWLLPRLSQSKYSCDGL